ncbi:MAG: hypothetical protein GY797_04660 [Deltaproteobacteria bacterium]|nr:hypothetical protein [Deltaproteobacteria bacterium]
MPKVIIIPYSQIENVCKEAVNYANDCQSDFSFYLIPPIELSNTPLDNHSAEFIDILNLLEKLKKNLIMIQMIYY